jgi:hypothetical protein
MYVNKKWRRNLSPKCSLVEPSREPNIQDTLFDISNWDAKRGSKNGAVVPLVEPAHLETWFNCCSCYFLQLLNCHFSFLKEAEMRIDLFMEEK